MPQYEPTLRSNYFKVKDPAAFTDLCDRFDLEAVTQTPETAAGTLHGFRMRHGEQTLTGSFQDNETQEDIEANEFLQLLSEQLASGWVAVIIEIGMTDLLVLRGRAAAVNDLGEIVYIDLNDIYERAGQLGPHLTPCEN